MGYTPAFDDIYMGTLYGKWPAAAVWATLLPLIDIRGRIDMSIQAIAGMTGWPLELLTKGIEQLMEPDPCSRTADSDGRRLVPIDPARPWGWVAVNHGKYRERARKQRWDTERTATGKDAERKRVERGTVPDASRDVPTCPDGPRSHTQTHTQTQTEEKNPTAACAALAILDQDAANFETFKTQYPKRSGNQPWTRARRAISARLDEGFTWEELLGGVERYAAWCSATSKVNTETVMQAATFCGPDKPFQQPWTLPANKSDVRLASNIGAAAEAKRRLFGREGAS